MSARKPLKIGFIPLVDAAALFVAADKGLMADEGLNVELAREISWSNLRDKLAVGLLDAAHLLAPMAIAAKLGLDQVKVPLVAPLNLAMNGNTITVSRALHAELEAAANGDTSDPALTARALSKVVRKRQRAGLDQITFGMTFPFSMHNYLLRYWIAEGGVDPDRDLRLVVLPPAYMVENLAKDQVQGFCVGAPWSSVAVEKGLGVILHMSCDIFSHAPEKVLALRENTLADDPEIITALTRALMRAASYVHDIENRSEVAAMLARPDRVGVSRDLIKATLAGAIPTGDGGRSHINRRFLIIDGGVCRPDPRQAAWIYAQMARWGQANYSAGLLDAARSVFKPDYYDRESVCDAKLDSSGVGETFGPAFDDRNIDAYLNGFAIGHKTAK